jgi:hypothetical protein
MKNSSPPGLHHDFAMVTIWRDTFETQQTAWHALNQPQAYESIVTWQQRKQSWQLSSHHSDGNAVPLEF